MISSSKRRFTQSCASAHGKPWAALAFAGVLASIAIPSYADEQPVAKSDSLEEIVVTAEFRKENLQDVPIAITSVTSQGMDERNMTNLTDVANVAPNVTMYVNS